MSKKCHKRPFIITVVVNQKNSRVIIKTADQCHFEACVDDGKIRCYVGCFEHVFSERGTYQISFYGDMDGLKVRDCFLPDSVARHNRDKEPMDHVHCHYDFIDASMDDYAYVFVDVVQWGDYYWKNVCAMFEDCLYIQSSASDAPDLRYVKSLAKMFYNAAQFNSYIGHWDISQVADLSEMFHGTHSFNQPLDKWDTSHVRDMHGMFCEAQFFNQPIGNWDVSKVGDMGEMFSDAWEFDQPIGDWDTSSVTDMHNMFEDAVSFNQPIGGWHTQNVCDMSGMFCNARTFNQPIGNWDTQNVRKMNYMFCDARAFNQPLANWKTSNVTDMSYMFGRAVSFNQSVEQWDMSNVKSVFLMFAYALNYAQSISGWNIRCLIEVNYVLHGTKVNIREQAHLNHLFYYCRRTRDPLAEFLPPEGICCKYCKYRFPMTQ